MTTHDWRRIKSVFYSDLDDPLTRCWIVPSCGDDKFISANSLSSRVVFLRFPDYCDTSVWLMESQASGGLTQGAGDPRGGDQEPGLSMHRRTAFPASTILPFSCETPPRLCFLTRADGNSHLVKSASAAGLTNCFSNIPNNSAGWAEPVPWLTARPVPSAALSKPDGRRWRVAETWVRGKRGKCDRASIL